MSRQITEESFLKDVASHQMEVVLDQGLHRHIRFARPGSYCMSFGIVTWPGYLAYYGDMGEFVFTRIKDMFEFFRRGKNAEDRLPINLQYWAEKVEAEDRPGGGVRRYDDEKFIANVKDQIEVIKESGEFSDEDGDIEVAAFQRFCAAVESEVIGMACEGEVTAVRAALDFEFDRDEDNYRLPSHEHRKVKLTDYWERSNDEYTVRFQWCCYAMVYAIEQYDAAKQPTPATEAA